MVQRSKNMLFWFFNWPIAPSSEESSVIRGLQEQHKTKIQKWFYISVVINLAPFVMAAILEFVLHEDNFICFLNNGSIPILSFSMLSTNLFYLLENIPMDKEDEIVYSSIKTKLLAVSVIILFISTILYIFQSNFLNSFNNSHLIWSLIFSIFMIIYAIASGKTMYLFQNEYVRDYKKNIDDQRKALNNNNTSDNDGTKF